MQQTQIHGLSTRLLTLSTVNGVNSYNLGKFNSSFESTEKIVAIVFRYDKGACLSINERPLIDLSNLSKGYLNLVDDKSSNILFSQNLRLMTDQDNNSYGIFIPPGLIKWTQSNIEFAPGVTFDGTQDLEFNIYYITDCQSPIQTNVLFDNAFQFHAVKKRTIQINAAAGKESFALGSNPLSNSDTIVGLRYNDFDFETTDGKTNVLKGSTDDDSTTALGASFLTMRIGSRTLLDNFPLIDLINLPYVGFPYFPIEPTKSDNFNWNKCKINLPGKNLTQDNTCYLLTLYYI